MKTNTQPQFKTVNDIQAIEWHLQNNVQPILNNAAVTGILRTLNDLNEGKISINDPVALGSFTVGEMCEDLKIELVEAY